jgi:NAD(P)-dependent dehydrogenase (short-subunit alcohol dehydrogenase family)
MNVKELEGRVALVTGAGRGIGRAISIALAQEGATLILTGRDLEALNETSRIISDLEKAPTPLVCQMDLLDSEAITTCVQSALEVFGHIDILVNNSGIAGKSAPLWE